MTISAVKEDLFFSLRYPQGRASVAVFAISILLMLTIGLAYWWPIMLESNKLKTEIDSRQMEIASAEYNLRLYQASSSAAEQMDMIEKKLDASVTQAVLVQNIASLARVKHVKISSVAYEEGKVKDGFLPLVHILTVQAGYAELRAFIAALQQLPTFTIAQEAVLSRSSNSAVIKAQLNITTYRRIVVP
jgi:Tfp pilus assembly protein PilO